VLAALALVVFGAYDSYPFKVTWKFNTKAISQLYHPFLGMKNNLFCGGSRYFGKSIVFRGPALSFEWIGGDDEIANCSSVANVCLQKLSLQNSASLRYLLICDNMHRLSVSFLNL